MSTPAVKTWGFPTDEGEQSVFQTTGYAAFDYDNGLATLSDPRDGPSQWGTRVWGWGPDGPEDLDDDFNVIFPVGVEMEMMENLSPYGITDFEFYFWLCRTGAVTGADDDIEFRFRIDTLLNDYLYWMFDTPAGLEVATKLFAEDGGHVLTSSGDFGATFPVGTWRLVILRAIGDDVWLIVEDENGNEQKRWFYGAVDRTDEGTIGFYLDADGERIWKTGSAAETAKPMSQFALAASGTWRLRSQFVYVLGPRFQSFNRLVVGYDGEYDPYYRHRGDVTLYYNLYHGGSWSGWTALDEKGDMSGVSASPGDRLLVGFDLSNDAEYRTWPALSSLDLLFNQTGVSDLATMRGVCNAIKTVLDADSDISSFAGWSTTRGCIICYEEDRDDIPLHVSKGTVVGIYICPLVSERPQQGEGMTGSEVICPAATWYNIAIYPTVALVTTDPSDLVTDSSKGLEAFTEYVEAALKVESFDGTTKWAVMGDTDRNVGGGFRDEKRHNKQHRILLRAFAGMDLL